jgi:hypothetical protein
VACDKRGKRGWKKTRSKRRVSCGHGWGPVAPPTTPPSAQLRSRLRHGPTEAKTVRPVGPSSCFLSRVKFWLLSLVGYFEVAIVRVGLFQFVWLLAFSSLLLFTYTTSDDDTSYWRAKCKDPAVYPSVLGPAVRRAGFFGLGLSSGFCLSMPLSNRGGGRLMT